MCGGKVKHPRHEEATRLLPRKLRPFPHRMGLEIKCKGKERNPQRLQQQTTYVVVLGRISSRQDTVSCIMCVLRAVSHGSLTTSLSKTAGAYNT